MEGIERLIEPLWDDGDFVPSRMVPGNGHGSVLLTAPTLAQSRPGTIRRLDVARGPVTLTGFGIASRLPCERQTPPSSDIIAGTLAYVAPERTRA